MSEMSRSYVDIDEDDFNREHPRFKRIASSFRKPSKDFHTPPKIWLVPGLIAAGETSLVFGKPGCGKSVFATDTACRLVSSLTWDGEDAGLYRYVLYIAAERSGQVMRRIKAFALEHGLDPLTRIIVYDGPIDLARRSDELVSIIRSAELEVDPEDQADIDLVVIDTVSAAMAAPDSNTEATAAVAYNVNRASRDTGAHIMLVTHTPLNGEARPRGGHLDGAADTTIHVTSKGGVSTATVMKNNDSDARPSVSYSMMSVVIGKDYDGEDFTAAVLIAAEQPAENKPKGPRLAEGSREALAILRGAAAAGPVSEQAWRDACYARYGDLSPSGMRKRFNRSKAELIRFEVITEDADTYLPKRDMAGH